MPAKTTKPITLTCVPLEVLWRQMIPQTEEIIQLLEPPTPQLREAIRKCMRRLMERLYIMPASESDHDRGAHGLLMHTFLVCIEALKQAREREGWFWEDRLAVFVMAAIHDVGKIQTAYATDNEGREWRLACSPLGKWVEENGSTSIDFCWLKGRPGTGPCSTESLGVAYISVIFPISLVWHIGRRRTNSILLGLLPSAGEPIRPEYRWIVKAADRACTGKSKAVQVPAITQVLGELANIITTRTGDPLDVHGLRILVTPTHTIVPLPTRYGRGCAWTGAVSCLMKKNESPMTLTMDALATVAEELVPVDRGDDEQPGPESVGAPTHTEQTRSPHRFIHEAWTRTSVQPYQVIVIKNISLWPDLPEGDLPPGITTPWQGKILFRDPLTKRTSLDPLKIGALRETAQPQDLEPVEPEGRRSSVVSSTELRETGGPKESEAERLTNNDTLPPPVEPKEEPRSLPTGGLVLTSASAQQTPGSIDQMVHDLQPAPGERVDDLMQKLSTFFMTNGPELLQWNRNLTAEGKGSLITIAKAVSSHNPKLPEILCREVPRILTIMLLKDKPCLPRRS